LEINRLGPAATEQKTFEREIVNIRKRLDAKRAAAASLKDREARLAAMRRQFLEIKDKLAEAKSKSVAATAHGELKAREVELLHQLAHRRANLDHDERFRSEVKNGMCPVMSAKCLNLAEGQTLEAFLNAQTLDLRSKISSLEAESARLAVGLKTAAEAGRFVEIAVGHEARQAELKAEGLTVAAEKAELERQAEGLASDEQLLADSENQLGALDNPSAKIQFLERQMTRETQIRKDLSACVTAVSTLESERNLLAGQVDRYKELDPSWSELSKDRDATAAAYRIYVANEAESNRVDQRKREVKTARGVTEASRLAREVAEQNYVQAQSGYDSDAHDAARVTLRDTDNLYHATVATLETAMVRASQLAEEIDRFAALRRSIQTELREKERLTTVGETTAYIRDTLKEAAPRVARNYVHHVSGEANQMFREITGNAEQTLKWAEDYSIILEQDGYERPFISLSGGEQMSAALAVRLALLKQLSDIRIAFFDEPTTNMDETRRENFAQQISRITNFDQLFVISHDDTFDHYVDQVIAV
jgi:exonuclease SbcC